MGNMHWRLHGTKPIETGRCAFRVWNGEMCLVDTWFSRDELILPEEVGGRPLTAIGEEAFCSTRLRRIVLPSTVRSIGRRAFAKRWHLACVVIPVMCFDMCRSLRGIELPAKLRQIGRYAFNRCTQLEEAALPDTVETINLLSFGCCSALKRISMPRGLRYVGPGAFLDCSSLHVPEIHEGAEVDEQAFAGCPGSPEAADDDWM